MNKADFQKNYNMLNPEQKKAVDTLDGPIMVIAWPGTGKTQIIGMRTANIILKAWVDASNILITTFTEAGVLAIRKRLISMIGSEAYKVQVSTIHSFAQDIIKSFPEKFTEDKMNTALDSIESLEIIWDILSGLLSKHQLEYLTTYGDPLFYGREISQQIQKIKWEGISPSDFQDIIDEEEKKSLQWLEEKRNNPRIKKIETYQEKHEKYIGKLRELQKIFQRYEEFLREKSLYDFHDMINIVRKRLSEDTQMQAYFAETFQYIMIDEYQDTNTPQNEIIGLIAEQSENPNIMVVGDDDQSIYRFQWANIENMLGFSTSYPQALLIVLTKNYRSTQSILDAAKSCIEHNSERLIQRIPGLKKHLISQVSTSTQWNIPSPWQDKSSVSLYEAATNIHEDLYILKNIEACLSSWVAQEDIAIIVRSNTEVIYYSYLLTQRGIALSSKFESNILDSDIIQLLLSCVKIVENPYEHEKDLLDVLRSRFSGICHMDSLKMSHFLYKQNYGKTRRYAMRIFDLLSNEQRLKELDLRDQDSCLAFVQKILDLQRIAAENNFAYFLSEMIEHFEFLSWEKHICRLEQRADILTLFHEVRSWMKGRKSMSIQDFLKKIELYMTHGYHISRIQTLWKISGIQVLTAHSSKGLEYEYVFVPWLRVGSWESKMTRKLISLPEWMTGNGLQFSDISMMSDVEKKKYLSERQMQEDRRLFFVAITRAKKRVLLSYPQSKDGKIHIISPFLWEIWEYDRDDCILSEWELAEWMKSVIQRESSCIEYADDIFVYIEQFFENYKLSASDLNTFLLSPKDFLYRTILCYPFEENENSIFGTMYHRTLELFYQQIQEMGKVPDIWYLHYVFDRQLEREFVTDEQFHRLKKRWYESLEWYYKKYEWTFRAPLKTEYKFSRRNVFFEEIPLTGIIDKIELISDDFQPHTYVDWGQGGLFSQSVRITDYKTWAAKYLWQIKWQDKDGNAFSGYEEGRHGRQLMFYKLLFENDYELHSQFQIGELELDFCEGKNGKYKRVSVEFTDEEYKEFQNLVKKSYAQMRDVDFWREFLG